MSVDTTYGHVVTSETIIWTDASSTAVAWGRNTYATTRYEEVMPQWLRELVRPPKNARWFDVFRCFPAVVVTDGRDATPLKRTSNAESTTQRRHRKRRNFVHSLRSDQ